jgi:hypothetical protein
MMTVVSLVWVVEPQWQNSWRLPWGTPIDTWWWWWWQQQQRWKQQHPKSQWVGEKRIDCAEIAVWMMVADDAFEYAQTTVQSSWRSGGGSCWMG